MKKVDLIILESVWDDENFAIEISVRPFFDGLSRVYDISYIYRTFYDGEDISYFIKKTRQNCSNYYIAAHGSGKYIHGINNKIIDTNSLYDIFKNSQGRGIYFGSCKFCNPKNAEEILNSTKADWIAGYQYYIDWFDSTIIDLAFWRYYLKGAEHNRGMKKDQWKVAKEIYTNYPMARRLGFTVFDKLRYGRKVNNSLQELQ